MPSLIEMTLGPRVHMAARAQMESFFSINNQKSAISDYPAAWTGSVK